MNFDQWRMASGVLEARFYSLGRHALIDAFQIMGLGAGDTILLPEFVCRDILTTLRILDLQPVWYAIGPDLRPVTSPDNWPIARAVLAVNYFGFPQPLEPFRAYAERAKAPIIEDNAHGFLSRDDMGKWLGTRGDIGIFSLRKTLSLADGAMLTVSQQNFVNQLPEQLPESGSGYSVATVWKNKLRRIPGCGPIIATLCTSLIRSIRNARMDSAIPCLDADAEPIPYPPMPHRGLKQRLETIALEREIERRRELYVLAEKSARGFGVEPIFSRLPPGTAPYGFPFHARSEYALKRIKTWATTHALDTIRWPDLPNTVAASAPPHYRNVNLINFL